MTLNNYFAHWLKEVDIRRYRDDIRILLTKMEPSIFTDTQTCS